MAACGCDLAARSGRSSVKQLRLFTPDSTEPLVSVEPRIVDSEAPKDAAWVESGSSDAVPPSPSVPPVLFVRHPRARRYLIRVRTDGSVRVTIPRRGSKREAVDFYERQQEWIARQRERVARARREIPVDIPQDVQRA